MKEGGPVVVRFDRWMQEGGAALEEESAPPSRAIGRAPTRQICHSRRTSLQFQSAKNEWSEINKGEEREGRRRRRNANLGESPFLLRTILYGTNI